MKFKSLDYKFPLIRSKDGLLYGGRQQCLSTETLRGFACGLIAAANIILCLDRRDGTHSGFFGELHGEEFDLDEYNSRVMRLLRYIPIFPKIGINGLSLVFGMAMYFRRYHMPYRIHWCISGRKLWRRMEDMLSEGIPVLFCVGPNFPHFRSGNGVNFYTENQDGSMERALSINEHYVTVTGINDSWVRVSSWGRIYYVNRAEYEEHVKKNSNYIFNNIALIRRK